MGAALTNALKLEAPPQLEEFLSDSYRPDL
jgi:hypothetical protein